MVGYLIIFFFLLQNNCVRICTSFNIIYYLLTEVEYLQKDDKASVKHLSDMQINMNTC